MTAETVRQLLAAGDADLNGAVQAQIDTQPAPQRRLTGFGLAERFKDQHGERFRHVQPWRQWLCYDGTHWRPDTNGQVQRAMMVTIRSIYDEAKAEPDSVRSAEIGKFAARSESESQMRAAIVLAQFQAGIAAEPSSFDRDLNAFNCLNGTIDLRTGALHEHDPSDLITKIAPVSYDPAADTAEWDGVLAQALPDHEWREFARRVFGYACLGDPVEQIVLLIYGPGATGKSTVVDAIAATMGDYALSTDFETYLVRRDVGGPRNDLARLPGARLVTSVEADPDRQIAVGLVKQITGGDPLMARKLYGDYFEFTPQFLPVWVVNALPKLRGADDAFWRRIITLLFGESIAPADRDPSVKARLGDPDISGAAILRWLVEGCLEWQRTGLRPPRTVVAATDELRVNTNPLMGWLEDSTTRADDTWTPTKDLRASYEQWCDSAGDRPVNSRAFADGLRESGFVANKQSGKRGWIGVTLGPGHLDTWTPGHLGARKTGNPLKRITRKSFDFREIRCPAVRRRADERRIERRGGDRMDALTLIRDARAAGVDLAINGDPRRLRIRSPRAAEKLARQVQAQRVEVIAALESFCAWCLEAPPDGGLDAGGRPWCAQCRDAEQMLQAPPPALVEGLNLRTAWAAAVLELGELIAHPELDFRPGHAVALGPVGWHQFVKHASVEHLRLVLARLRVLVAELPKPGAN